MLKNLHFQYPVASLQSSSLGSSVLQNSTHMLQGRVQLTVYASELSSFANLAFNIESKTYIVIMSFL